jgi:hypothetical protein
VWSRDYRWPGGNGFSKSFFKNVWCLTASIKLIQRKLWRTHIKRLQCDGTARTFFRVMSLSLNLFILSDKHYYRGYLFYFIFISYCYFYSDTLTSDNIAFRLI